MNNEIQNVLVVLATLFVPFLGLVTVNTEYFTKLFNVNGNVAKLLSSGFGMLFAALVAVYYWFPVTSPYIATFLFLDLAWVGPSGGYDLIMKFADRVSGK